MSAKIVLTLLAFAGVWLDAASEYEKKILAEREHNQAEIRKPSGPLYIIGQYQIQDGLTTMGSAQGSAIKLPDHAPALVGTIQRRGDHLTFQPASSVAVMKDGKKIEGPTPLHIDQSAGDTLQAYDFSFEFHTGRRGLLLNVRDPQSPYAKNFHGLSWFPVNLAYQLEATFTPYAEKTAKIPDTQGGTREMRVPGFVTFVLGGKRLRLDVFANSPDYLFVMFKDATSGKESYGAGRFLQVEEPKNGKAIVDFNEAYNPTCAVSPFYSCPIVPKESILPVRVEAGEKYTGNH